MKIYLGLALGLITTAGCGSSEFQDFCTRAEECARLPGDAQVQDCETNLEGRLNGSYTEEQRRLCQATIDEAMSADTCEGFEAVTAPETCFFLRLVLDVDS